MIGYICDRIYLLFQYFIINRKVVRGIKQSNILRVKELFPGSEIVRKFSYKMIVVRDSCALLARAYRRLSQVACVFGAESAYFYDNDCFECQPPRKSAA